MGKMFQSELEYTAKQTFIFFCNKCAAEAIYKHNCYVRLMFRSFESSGTLIT